MRFGTKSLGAFAGLMAILAAGPVAAQPARTPTTKILAIGTLDPGADARTAMRILPSEMRATAQLYLDGKIDQWYSLEDHTGVVFILNVQDLAAARGMLEQLPLGQAHLMSFQLRPIGPLAPMRQLLDPPNP
jgi:hypothetical protein